VLKLYTGRELWLVVQYGCSHVMEAEFEVVGVKKIGCESTDFEALLKLDF
jgi:hypothetical protein